MSEGVWDSCVKARKMRCSPSCTRLCLWLERRRGLCGELTETTASFVRHQHETLPAIEERGPVAATHSRVPSDLLTQRPVPNCIDSSAAEVKEG